ncbi:hypothetical protein AMTR_s00119p00071260, partial [Amborella trichopoda]
AASTNTLKGPLPPFKGAKITLTAWSSTATAACPHKVWFCADDIPLHAWHPLHSSDPPRPLYLAASSSPSSRSFPSTCAPSRATNFHSLLPLGHVSRTRRRLVTSSSDTLTP